MEAVEVSRHPDGRRRFYGRLFRESGTPFVSERSANTATKILKGFYYGKLPGGEICGLLPKN
jgi:hypothetical protein